MVIKQINITNNESKFLTLYVILGKNLVRDA